MDRFTIAQRWEILNNCYVDFGHKIFFSDEAHFDLGGFVNKQKCWIWTSADLYVFDHKSIAERVTASCVFFGIMAFLILTSFKIKAFW